MRAISSPEAASLALIILNLPSQAVADSPRRRAEEDQPEAASLGLRVSSDGGGPFCAVFMNKRSTLYRSG
jgi:hypothetical protein